MIKSISQDCQLPLFLQRKKNHEFWKFVYLKAEQFILLSKKTILPHPVVIIPILWPETVSFGFWLLFSVLSFSGILCDLPRFDEIFFNCFYHQYWPFSVSASCCFQCSFIFRLAMVASDRINRLFHRLHQFPSILAGAKKYMWFPTKSLASSVWFYCGWSELKLWRHQFLSIYLTADILVSSD
jgi:hypothetical protein